MRCIRLQRSSKYSIYSIQSTITSSLCSIPLWCQCLRTKKTLATTNTVRFISAIEDATAEALQTTFAFKVFWQSIRIQPLTRTKKINSFNVPDQIQLPMLTNEGEKEGSTEKVIG